MVAGMLGMPIAVGWVMHFMVGIIFAFAYTYLFKLKIGSVVLKGALFGIAAFIFAQIMMMMMMPMPTDGSMTLIIVGRLMGHIVFGIAIAMVVGKNYQVSNA